MQSKGRALKLMSLTWGKLTMDETVDKIIEYIKNTPKHMEIEITIGTDSQQFSDTKIVAVVVVRAIGNGGVFFYDVSRIKNTHTIREKIYKETEVSLKLADTFIEMIQNKGYMKQELTENKVYIADREIKLSIHIDVGENGPTSKLIPEITGWIKACGYGIEVKPNSFAASTVADKLSK